MGEDPPKFLITRRCSCYKKETKSEPEGFWKSGFHLWVFKKGGYSTQDVIDLRLKCLEARVLDSFLERYSIYNPPSDAFDASPGIRSNGLIIVGDRKRGLATLHSVLQSGGGVRLWVGISAREARSVR